MVLENILMMSMENTIAYFFLLFTEKPACTMLSLPSCTTVSQFFHSAAKKVFDDSRIR